MISALLGGGGEEGLALLDGADGCHQVGVGLGLQDVARSAGLERLEQVALVVVHRKDQDRDLGRLLADLARGLQAGELGHLHVEDREVGALADREVAGLGAVGGLADDLDVRLALEQHANARADDSVVIGDHDAHAAQPPLGERPNPEPMAMRPAEAMLPSTFPIGTRSRTLVPTLRARLDSQVSAHQERTLSHAAHAQSAAGLIEGEATAVVGDVSSTVPSLRARRHLDVFGLGVLRRVRQGFLGDAVDDELGVGREVRSSWSHPA